MKFLNSKTYYIFLFIITLLQSPAHIFACGSAASDAERLELQGLEKLKKGKSQDALQLFIRAGKLGNPRAYCMAGVMYDSSNVAGVSRNDLLALKYYKLALKIDSNCGPALHGIGAFTYHGRGGIEKNREEAIRLWKLGAGINDVGCFYDLGVCEMEEGRTGHAIFWFRKSAPYKPMAAHNLGVLLINGVEIEEGIRWLISAAKKGVAPAIKFLQDFPILTPTILKPEQLKDVMDIKGGKYKPFPYEYESHGFFNEAGAYQDHSRPRLEGPKVELKVCSRDNCKKSENLKLCSRCNSIYYCSRECQVTDWPRHREKDCRPRLEGPQ